MLADLAGWVLRRPVDVPPGSRVVAHSADVRTAVWAVAATELVLDVAVDAMVPPAYRPLHLAWVAVSMVLVLGSCAMTLRTPHLIDGRVLRLRTGPLRELALPLGEVRHVRRAHGSVPGHGLRRVPGEDEAVACSVSRATTMVLELDRPLTVRVGRGAPVAARRVYFAADRPAEAARLIGLAAR
nr:hypothetical protein OG409_19035 [Streptomyces sp. NBC_00974]